ncbi:MAG: ABC transporter permease [Candidatus Spechtbacterales bacterium]|nr:ABC transporter permease [Candidatus Spechtbacterales bacterium]
MKLKHTIRSAVDALKIHKSRSALTVLGILIAIASIIMMVSIGEGARGLILNELGGFGAETIVIAPGQEPTGPSDIGNTLFADSLTNDDIEELKKKGNVPDLVEVYPIVIVSGSVSYEGETYTPTIYGGSADFFVKTLNIYPEQGTVYDETDIRQNANVAVIGSKVKEELFGNSEALGQYIRVKDRKMRVVGVLPQKGTVSFLNIDELVLIPYTTAQTYLLGIDHYHEIDVVVKSPKVVDRAVADIERTLRNSHGITDPDDDDFYVVTQEAIIEQINTILTALTIFLSSVVAIALVVGGIGVMNIMLVSVVERTKEIGLRKALGATSKDISRQFLVESMILSAAGGVVGIIMGGFMGFLAYLVVSTYFFPEWTYVFPVGAAVLGFTVSSIVGLIFGIYPAKQAAKKSPIEALRYE